MAMMMTGRVLLVCALCVLWCGAGGRCDEVGVRAPAGGAVDESEPLVQSQELGTSSQGSKELEDGAPVVKRESTPAPPTPSDGEDDDEDDDGEGEGDGQEGGSFSEQLEETVEDAPGKQKTKPEIQNKEQELRQPPKAQVDVLQQPQPQPHSHNRHQHLSQNLLLQKRVKVLARTGGMEQVSPHWEWKIMETRIQRTPEKKTH
ncbi:mucin-associated surface protein [Trypanosoma cruzi cruzi]|nr:mucin-associated surface protein [Trypanosoma cruzi cruzi]